MVYLFKYRFVVVDIVYTHDDLGSGVERVWPTWGVVIGRRDIEDVLHTP